MLSVSARLKLKTQKLISVSLYRRGISAKRKISAEDFGFLFSLAVVHNGYSQRLTTIVARSLGEKEHNIEAASGLNCCQTSVSPDQHTL